MRYKLRMSSLTVRSDVFAKLRTVVLDCAKTVKSCKIREKHSSTEVDYVLCGNLRVVTVLVKTFPELKLQVGQEKDGVGLIDELYNNTLFAVVDKHGRSIHAKAQTEESRRAAFELLTGPHNTPHKVNSADMLPELCSNCPVNYQSAVVRLAPQHLVKYRSLNTWAYHPGAEVKSPTGYVGASTITCNALTTC